MDLPQCIALKIAKTTSLAKIQGILQGELDGFFLPIENLMQQTVAIGLDAIRHRVDDSSARVDRCPIYAGFFAILCGCFFGVDIASLR